MRIFLILCILFAGVSASELKAMQDACERGVAEACYELGAIYSGEEGLKPNIEKSKIYYEKACNLNHDKSCVYLEKLNSIKN